MADTHCPLISLPAILNDSDDLSSEPSPTVNASLASMLDVNPLPREVSASLGSIGQCPGTPKLPGLLEDPTRPRGSIGSVSTLADESPASPSIHIPGSPMCWGSSEGSEQMLCEYRAEVWLQKWHLRWVKRTLVVSSSEVMMFSPHPVTILQRGLTKCLQRQATGRLVSFPSPKSDERGPREAFNRDDIVACRIREHKKLEIMISTRYGGSWRVRCCSLESLPILYRCLSQGKCPTQSAS
ncbi:unnamed protein product [Vitrella brassicaformis CCMP3155]|uniref:PH domain-containing protein n=1 Tax=Vitrella brassicaformis (strain CCMP3155) TaxID=1169540 RepID=A0A0G4EUN9_VITBC|nr:unnamed protein product [Vitrella brassicaformis CCMP3155]|mmetsp:Transcript_35497/g.102010  ORF Transcript_35497/g.102010 Transcript_35497/m.102010 type:complete len:240 (-) Transcript_35497:174-893(-)|eukprot:CEM02164.1 unnamed protein product [Vitrella brassicaformis CCMP3155]